MAFWGVEVKPGKPFTHRVSDPRRRLHLSQATLGVGKAANKSIVQCNVGDKSPVFLCSLFPDKAESCQLNLEFEEAAEVIFSVIGPRSVHLTGYYLNRNQNFVLNDENSESYGEDIEDTDGERSSSKNDYDYSDSFIDDGDPKAYQDSSVSDSDDELTLKERADRKKEKKGNVKHRRLRKKYQVSDSDAEKNWKLGVFSGAGDSSSGDSLELHDTESEREVQELPSSKSALPSRNKMSEARENPSLDKECSETSLKKKRKEEGQEGTFEGLKNPSNGAQNHKQTINNENKSSSNILSSSKEEPCGNLSKKKVKKEWHEGSVKEISGVEGVKSEQNMAEGTQDAKQSFDGGGKSSKNVLQSSTKDSCGTFSKKKKRKKGQEGTVEVSSVVEGSKSQENLSGGTQNEKQATDKGIKLSGNILPSSEDGCETPLKKKRKKEGQVGTIEVNSCVNRVNVQQNLSELTENGEQAADKNIKKEAEHLTDHPQTCRKTSKVQDEDDADKLDCSPISGKKTTKHEPEDNRNRSSKRPPKLETFSNGLMIEELDKGNLGGKSAVKGRKVSIIYTGKLKENGQVFDSNVGKDPLRFRLGKGKVIEGLDIGVEGMQVGDKRRLIIPPSLRNAREEKIENVPADSWLVYDVEVVKV